MEGNDYERAQETTEQGRTWISTDKSHEKEKRPHLPTSRQFPVDASLRSDDLESSGLSLDDRHRPLDNPGKPLYYDYRELSSSRDNYAHRDQQVPFPDPHPIPARSSYGNERNYGPQHSTPPKREPQPISRQVSFTRQPHVDLDDDNDEREMDRGRGRDRERYWDGEYDRREEVARKEEEIRRMEEEVKGKEENAARNAEKAKKMEAVVTKKEADVKRREKEVRKKEEDIKRKEEGAKEEAKRKAEELSRKEEEAKQRGEDLENREEEAHKKTIKIEEMENILRQCEEELTL